MLDINLTNTLHGTGPGVGAALERMHEETAVDEIMLVTGGHSSQIQTRTVELITDRFGLPG